MTRYLFDLKKSEGAKLLLVLFPPVGGSASFYKKWVSHFDSSVNVVAIQLPGRANRFSESLVTSMDYVVNKIVSELSERCEDDSVFFGHSMGGLMAFYTAKRMALDGLKKPVKLYISSSPSPGNTGGKKIRMFTEKDQFNSLCNKAPELVSSLSKSIYMHELHDSDFVAYLKIVGVLPANTVFNADLASIALPVIRADYAMIERAVYKESTVKMDIPITVMYGESEDRDSKDDFKKWSEKTSSICEFKTFPGDHYYLKTATDSVASFVSSSLISAKR